MSKFKKGQCGNPSGRPPGSGNKVPAVLKEAIIKAAELAGGEEGLTGYLQAQANANPSAFLGLLGKVLPLQMAGVDGLRQLVEVKLNVVQAQPARIAHNPQSADCDKKLQALDIIDVDCSDSTPSSNSFRGAWPRSQAIPRPPGRYRIPPPRGQN